MLVNDLNLLFIITAAVIVGITVGFAVGGWLSRQKHIQTEALLSQQLEQYQLNVTVLKAEREQLQQAQLQTQLDLGQYKQLSEQLPQLQHEKSHWQKQYQQSQKQIADLRAELESNKAAFEQQRLAAEDKLQMLKDAESRLKGEFENLANKIFEQKNDTFTKTNKAGLDALLTPLKEQIEGFKRQISDQYVKEGQQRTALKTEILGLKALNQQITEEAAALTKALKGDNKQQGNWGEVVLERILTESGLREGHEYQTQAALADEQGKKFQPDILVHLPNGKDIVIDSKVSLSAYNQYFHAQGEVDRQRSLNDHIASLRTHIKGLGAKNYQNLCGIRTLDYVLMFVPIEPAFLLAVEQAPELVQLALDNNIMLVSPTNLLVALRTIHNIWQVEQQNQNAVEIAQKAGALYDKFVAFTEDIKGLGLSLQTVDKKYQSAVNKLSEGRGNLIRRSEELRKLGVQASKRLNEPFIDKAQSD